MMEMLMYNDFFLNMRRCGMIGRPKHENSLKIIGKSDPLSNAILNSLVLSQLFFSAQKLCASLRFNYSMY